MNTNPGRGEQVMDHYLPGAVTNYERKKYRKKKRKLHENLIGEFCETEESRFEQPRTVSHTEKRGKLVRRWSKKLVLITLTT